MNDEQLRALVRAAVERHLGGPASGSRVPAEVLTAAASSALRGERSAVGGDASHYVYVSLVNTTEECVIEPGVRCNHCNYCKSHGH